MNPKPKVSSSSSSSPEPLQGPPPPVQLLQDVFSSFQTNLSNFIRSSVKFPVLTRHTTSHIMNPETLQKILAVVPVYAVKRSSGEVVAISDSDSRKTIGLVCFSKDDAISLLERLKSIEPFMQNDVRIMTTVLDKFVKVKSNRVSYRLIPEASQVLNAIQERKISGANDNSFTGVPVFLSKNLIGYVKHKRCRLAFFKKEDYERFKQVAFRNMKNPELVPDNIQIAVLEDLIRGMKSDLSFLWNDIVFIPPGCDIETQQH